MTTFFVLLFFIVPIRAAHMRPEEFKCLSCPDGADFSFDAHTYDACVEDHCEKRRIDAGENMYNLVRAKTTLCNKYRTDSFDPLMTMTYVYCKYKIMQTGYDYAIFHSEGMAGRSIERICIEDFHHQLPAKTPDNRKQCVEELLMSIESSCMVFYAWVVAILVCLFFSRLILLEVISLMKVFVVGVMAPLNPANWQQTANSGQFAKIWEVINLLAQRQDVLDADKIFTETQPDTDTSAIIMPIAAIAELKA